MVEPMVSEAARLLSEGGETAPDMADAESVVTWFLDPAPPSRGGLATRTRALGRIAQKLKALHGTEHDLSYAQWAALKEVLELLPPGSGAEAEVLRMLA